MDLPLQEGDNQRRRDYLFLDLCSLKTYGTRGCTGLARNHGVSGSGHFSLRGVDSVLARLRFGPVQVVDRSFCSRPFLRAIR